MVITQKERKTCPAKAMKINIGQRSPLYSTSTPTKYVLWSEIFETK